MQSKTTILIIVYFELISNEILLESINNFPDYGQPSFQHPKDIRQRFIKNRKRNGETARRIRLLNKYLPNNTVYVDEIAHREIVKSQPEWKTVNEIESEFRNVVAMRGLKYTYKRDTYWRTWRLVHFPGEDRVICYRSENTLNFTNNPNGGFWVIEEKPPPCPYELFSISKEDKICAVHLNMYHNVRDSCSSEITLSELTGACDNPVLTEWRIEKRFNDKFSERFPSIICGGRQSCSILTIYKIASDYISFRIVNMTNDVIYSRIMKQGKNYACIEHCGIMNPYSKTISTMENYLRINLLNSKNKREDKVPYINKLKRISNSKPNKRLTNNKPNTISFGSINKRQDRVPYKLGIRSNINKINDNKIELNTDNKHSIVEDTTKKTTRAPTCKALKLSLVQDEMDEDY